MHFLLNLCRPKAGQKGLVAPKCYLLARIAHKGSTKYMNSMQRVRANCPNLSAMVPLRCAMWHAKMSFSRWQLCSLHVRRKSSSIFVSSTQINKTTAWKMCQSCCEHSSLITRSTVNDRVLIGRRRQTGSPTWSQLFSTAQQGNRRETWTINLSI